MPSPRSKIVILLSGSGSNLQAIIEQVNNGNIDGEIVAVISNIANVRGLQRASDNNIPAITIAHKDFSERSEFDLKLKDTIDGYNPDLLVLAGFMRILTEDFVKHFKGRMLNIHPSLLPKYPGLHTHQRALDAKDKEHGTSIHFVTEELDGGPIILQRKFLIEDDDTAETLHMKVQKLEHRMYPEVIRQFCDGTLSL